METLHTPPYQQIFGFKQSKIRTALVVVLSTSLVACGGGGGGSSSTLPVIADAYVPAEPIDLSSYSISPGTYDQQTTTKVDAFWDEGYKGQGVTIGFVDSGVNPDHIDFYDDNGYSRVNWQDARGVVSNDGYSIDFNNDYVDIDNPDYHGTHITSIAAGREFGVAPKATILPVNVFFDNSSAYNTVIHAAVDYVSKKAPIINASITEMVNFAISGGSSSEYNSYLNTLQNSNSVMVTAAGNGVLNTDTGFYEGIPIGAEHFENYNSYRNLSIDASLENKILHAIALNSDTDTIASFSNYPGSCSDVTENSDISCDGTVMNEIQNNFISVPGTLIEAAYGGYDGTINTDYSASYSGTSMATPIVSGGLALLLSKWPQLSPQEAVSILKESAYDEGIYADSSIYGVGLMDLYAASLPSNVPVSAPSSSLQASFSINESSATIPSELKSLSKLPDLSSVAYFDKYDRDFLFDISNMLQIEKAAIEWNQFWADSATTTNHYPLKDATLTVAFNANSEFGLQQLDLQSANYNLSYATQAANGFVSMMSMPEIKHFHNMQQKEFGHSIATSYALTPDIRLTAGFQSALQSSLDWQDASAQEYPQKQNQGLVIDYALTDHLQFGLGTEFTQQENAFSGAYGTGVFAFGEENLIQSNLVSMNLKQGKNRLFSQYRFGKLIENQASDGSYLQINDAHFAELKLGWVHQSSDNQLWGVQTFNTNQLMDADITLQLPVGLTADGKTEINSVRYHHQASLKPDSLELFYHARLNQFAHLQMNYIHTPDDSGLGLMLRSQF